MNNPKTTITGIIAATTAALTLIAALPYQLGDVATIIPPDWKPWVFKAGLLATFLLRIIKSVNTSDSPSTPPAQPKQPQPTTP